MDPLQLPTQSQKMLSQGEPVNTQFKSAKSVTNLWYVQLYLLHIILADDSSGSRSQRKAHF